MKKDSIVEITLFVMALFHLPLNVHIKGIMEKKLKCQKKTRMPEWEINDMEQVGKSIKMALNSVGFLTILVFFPISVKYYKYRPSYRSF